MYNVDDTMVLDAEGIIALDLHEIAPKHIFNDLVIDFLDKLSQTLFADKNAKNFPDVISFAFFCRRSNITKLATNYLKDKITRVGRGLVFHISPSNVPVNFAYSLIAGLLSGNSNLVRLPSKKFKQIDIILYAISKITKQERFESLQKYLLFTSYNKDHDSSTEKLSLMSSVRMIWGGDRTIQKIRSFKVNPKTYDIIFPDRYSFSMINADKVLDDDAVSQLVPRFYSDTFLFDQNACTSPHLVIWQGSDLSVRNARKIFWKALQEYVALHYTRNELNSIDNLVVASEASANGLNFTLHRSMSGSIWQAELSELTAEVEKFRSYGGYFYELNAGVQNDFLKIINSKFQTLSYFGYKKSELMDLFSAEYPRGIDRIVPIGRTAEFSLSWDGYDLIYSLSRVIDIK